MIWLNLVWEFFKGLGKAFYALFGVAGLVVVGVVLFYEGVPILGNWPLNKIPYAGKVFEGEISRRIAAHDLDQQEAFDKARIEAQEALAEQERDFREQERIRSASNKTAFEGLHKKIRELGGEITDAESEALEAQIVAARAKREADRTAVELQLLKDNPDVKVETVYKTVNGQCKPKVIYRKIRDNKVPDDIIDALRKIQ